MNTYTNNEQSALTAAMNAAGTFVVGWRSSGQDGSSWGVYAQRYAADGTAQGSEFKVNTYTSSEQRDPAVAMDGSGNFVLAWHSNGQDGSGWGIYGQRYAADGTAQGSEFKANSYTTSDQLWPAVAMDATGEFIVTWRSNQDGSGYGVYAQRFAADGTAADGEFRVNTYTTNDQLDPAVIYGSGGEALIAWESSGQDGSGWGVCSRVYGTGLAQADLVPVTSAAPLGVNRGQNVDVAAQLRNQGGTDAGGFGFRYYLSPDPVITTEDTPLSAVINVAGLAAYATHTG